MRSFELRNETYGFGVINGTSLVIFFRKYHDLLEGFVVKIFKNLSTHWRKQMYIVDRKEIGYKK